MRGNEIARRTGLPNDAGLRDTLAPLVERWARREGRDRDGASLEIDVVAPLADGRVMTGAAKPNARPLDIAGRDGHPVVALDLEDLFAG